MKKQSAKDGSQEPPASSLQQEAAAAPESAWFFAWFKSALLYLSAVSAYLAAIIGFVAAWKKFVADQGEKADLTIYALASVLALPLLFALLFNLLPSLRRRRERNLRPTSDQNQKVSSTYFQTSPRTDDPYGFFAKGYEPFREWTRRPPAPLLHLTGLSGSGKSSLLSAFLKPQLAAESPDGKTTLLIIRSYRDPLLSLKETLLALWKNEPPDYQELSPLEAMHRASRQIDGPERLLLAFDQFEEFFLIRANLSASPEKEGEPAIAATVAEADIAPLRDFFHAFLAGPPARVTLLLSYREDHRRLLAALNLPSRQERINWMTIDPFDFATAAAFLRSCPGLSVPDARMDRVLREAARQEGGRVVMRPIVANLLGVVLRQMSGHPTLWRRRGDLLRGYVRDCLGEEMKEERARLLRALLTDFHTARPRSIDDIASEIGLDTGALDTELDYFGRAGLLRCVNSDEPNPARRVWQIAHDFVATLIERVLDALHRTFWRTVRPWLAPITVCLALIVIFVQPWIQRHRDISLLANAGFTWNQMKSQIEAAGSQTQELNTLDRLSHALHRLKPRLLDLDYCSALENVDGLKGLTSLQTLSLRECRALENVDVLKGLSSLQTLDLSYCPVLVNVDVLKGLRSLQTLNLTDCRALKNVDGLKGLGSLQTLDLSFCKALENVDGLKGLSSLQTLSLRDCQALENVDVLKGLTSLQTLDLSYCKALENADGLKGLGSLQTLKLRDCQALENVDVLKGLTSLQTLDLSQCQALENVDVLKGLTSLQTLDLSFCRPMKNVDGLKGLTSLRALTLSFCPVLVNVDVLKGLTSLQTLDLNYCSALENVDGLKGLPSLQTLSLNACLALKNVDGLKGLTSLQTLDLSHCQALKKESLPSLISTLPTTRIISP